MNKFIKLTLIILWSLIFYIFDAPSGMRFFSVPSLEMLPYILLNFSGYGVLFLICFGFERSELKKTAAAFAVTLPFKFAIDMLLPLMTEKMALEAWSQDIAFLMQAAVIMAVTTAVKKSRPSVKKLAFAAVGAVLIIVSGFVGGGVLNEVAYKYAISADSPYAKNLVYYVNGVKEIYALAVFAARCLIAVGISAEASEKYSFSFKWTGAAAAVYLAFNCIFNTANIFSGINTGYAASDKADGAISVEQSFFELYRGSGDTRYSCCLSVKNHVFVGYKSVTKYNTNPLAACGWNIDFTDPDGKSFACQTEKLVYLKDNKWCEVKFKDLHKITEDKLITECLKAICNTGSAEALEYAAPYLKKYAPDYLYDLTENFSENQTEVSGNQILTEAYISDVLSNIE